MSCIAEDRFIELLDQGGLHAVRPEERAHIEACEACRESWGSVAAAGEVLAQARPAGRAARWIPLAAAAGTLLAIVGVLAVQQTPSPVVTPMKDPVGLFIDGSPDEMKAATEALLKMGRRALPGMAAARPRLKGFPRERLFLDLMWQIKIGAAAQDPEHLAILRKLEATKVDLQFETTAVNDILSFIRSFSNVNLVLDPKLDPGIVETFTIRNQSLRYSLEILCALKDLDFDVKYGVVFVSTPMRLWSTDPAVGLPAANRWSTQELDAAGSEMASKLRTIRVTLDIQSAPMSAITLYFVEISGLRLVHANIPDEPVSLKFSDVTLANALQLLTLPRGWDVRIEKGHLEIFTPGE